MVIFSVYPTHSTPPLQYQAPLDIEVCLRFAFSPSPMWHYHNSHSESLHSKSNSDIASCVQHTSCVELNTQCIILKTQCVILHWMSNSALNVEFYTHCVRFYAILLLGNLCRKFELFCREAFVVVNSCTFRSTIFWTKNVSVKKWLIWGMVTLPPLTKTDAFWGHIDVCAWKESLQYNLLDQRFSENLSVWVRGGFPYPE